MKSVGEVMAIGRTFKESIQKHFVLWKENLSGFDRVKFEDKNDLIFKIRNANEKRLLYVAQAFREGFDVKELYELCKIDPWFLSQIKEIVDFEEQIDMDILHNKTLLRKAKTMGFSDKMIALLVNLKDNLELSQNDIYYARMKQKIIAEFSEVDTCAGNLKL